MSENVSIQKYAYTKNVVYQLYPVLKGLSDNEKEAIFSTFEKLDKVARNTYLFPYDRELFNDIKKIKFELLLDSHLQEKYDISDQILKEKYEEYRFYEFGQLLNSSLLDVVSMEKFDYQKMNENRDGEGKKSPKNK